MNEVSNKPQACKLLLESLDNIDAVLRFLDRHGIPRADLFDPNVCERLRHFIPKNPVSSYLFPDQLKEDFIKEFHVDPEQNQTLSRYCYKIANVTRFQEILRSLEFKYVHKVLAVIDSIALLRIRDIEADEAAKHAAHGNPTTQDKTVAADAIFDILRRQTPNADQNELESLRNKLQLRIEEGNRWKTFVGEELGLVVMVAHKLPPTMKFSCIPELAFLLKRMPEVQIATQATSFVQRLLDLKLQPWENKSGHIDNFCGVGGSHSISPVNHGAPQAGVVSWSDYQLRPSPVMGNNMDSSEGPVFVQGAVRPDLYPSSNFPNSDMSIPSSGQPAGFNTDWMHVRENGVPLSEPWPLWENGVPLPEPWPLWENGVPLPEPWPLWENGVPLPEPWPLWENGVPLPESWELLDSGLSLDLSSSSGFPANQQITFDGYFGALPIHNLTQQTRPGTLGMYTTSTNGQNRGLNDDGMYLDPSYDAEQSSFRNHETYDTTHHA